MKRSIKRAIAAAAALALVMTQSAMASEAMGGELHQTNGVLSKGTTLTSQTFWSDTYSDLRTERYVSYAPNADVIPTVAFGTTVLSRETLSTMATTLQNQGKRVVGGTNGDLYVLSTGEPLGMVVTDGVLRSSASYHYAVGFNADGTAFVGQPQLLITATVAGERLTVFGGVNKVRAIRSNGGGGLTLLTRDFGATTQNTQAGVDVFLKIVPDDVGTVVSGADNGTGYDLTLSDAPKIGGRVKCVVEYVSEAAGENPIPEGGMVLTMNAKDDPGTLNMLRTLQSGDEVNIDITSQDSRWSGATQALGGMFRLLENGQIGSDASLSLATERTARTAIGVKADGSTVFYTIDGKQPGLSVGATSKQVAMRLQELGCVEAIGLDGGGSTTIGATYPDKSTMEVVNSPSDGGERKNSTAIFLTTTMRPTGVLGALMLEPGDPLVLSGTTVQMSATGLDTSYYAMTSGPVSGVSYTAIGAGAVTPEGAFTAGSGGGVATVTGAVGAASGYTNITVIQSPDKIAVAEEATGTQVGGLSLESNETIALQAAASYRDLALLTQDTSFTWTVDGGIGTITPDGTFTAGSQGGSGSITVSAGGKSVTIPVSVAIHIHALDDMEGVQNFPATDTVQTSTETALDHVRTGRGSLRVDYTATDGVANAAADLALDAQDRYLGLWVYGDGSGNSLTAEVADGAGTVGKVALTGLDFTGWKHVTAALPEGAAKLTGLQVVVGGGQSDGTVWLDQLTVANMDIYDQQAPSVSVKASGTAVTVTASDDLSRDLSVSLTYDGNAVTGTWNNAAGTYTAAIPDPGLTAHRLTATVTDASGNIGRGTCDLPGSTGAIFADMDDHWAAQSANYLYQQGITTGVSTGGTPYFQPDVNMTRAEFATMVARWMGLDLTQYESVQLPFADAAGIPAWALSAVKAMYQKGLVAGSQDGNVLNFHAANGITRAEAMTILGRTQARGYREDDLSGFTDKAQVPAWSEVYVRSLVGQGVVNGYEDGTLKPNASVSRAQVAKMLYTLR